MDFYRFYKKWFHFSINFYSVFLLITFIPDIVGVPQGAVKYGFWGLKVLLAVWIIFNYRKKVYDLQSGEKLFLFVAGVYFINIFIDVFLQNYPKDMGLAIDLLSFFVTILVALSFRYDKALSSKKSFYFYAGSLTIGLTIAFVLSKEHEFPYQGRFYANTTVNSIVYGQMGCALALIGVYGLFKKKKLWLKLLFFAMFCLGVLSIMKAGSRSPIVVLVVVSGFYAFARLGIFKGILISVGAIILFWLSLGFIIKLGETFDSSIIARVERAVEEGETSGRDKIWGNTIGLIKESPVFGSFYLVSSGRGKNQYPHNFFLEAFMTTGIIGGIPFVIMILISLYRSFHLIKNDHRTSWIVLMYLQMLVYGMFSSSLYSSQDFWALCLLILSVQTALETKKAKKEMDWSESELYIEPTKRNPF